MRVFLLLSLLAIPTVTQAAVQIVEVVWMGGVDSANHEWIELYNDGETIDVSDWALTDSANLEITLAGTIAAGERVVLERTSESSAPGSAFLVYTGALVNGGTVLTLTNSQGNVVDQVVGGDGWENIGGDNVSKATAQLLNGAWVTAIATPGSAVSQSDVQVSAVVESDSETDTSTTDDSVVVTNTVNSSSPTLAASSRSSSGEAIVLTLPDVTLQLEVQAPGYVHINEPVTYKATASDIGDTLLDSLQYVWNFGDGTTGVGSEVTHSYQYPGRYVVVLQAGYKRQQQMTRFEIDIVAPTLSLEQQGQMIELVNEGDREINLGDYALSGVVDFNFPEYSILLPGQTIILPVINPVQIGRSSMVMLHDQSGRVVARDVRLATQATADPLPTLPNIFSAVPLAPLAFAQTDVVSPEYSFDTNVNENSTRFGFASESRGADLDQVETNPFGIAVAEASTDITATSQVATLSDTAGALPDNWPLYTLVGVLLLGVLSVLLIPSKHAGDRVV